MISVVGLGAMGLGIAQVFAAAGMAVTATDTSAEARSSALPRLRAALAPRVAKGAMTPEALEALLARVTVANRLEDLRGDLVIEAVAERLEVKQALFAALEGVLPGAVLATNTSSLQVAAIARALARPGRLVGLHFFNPAPVMKLVELIGGEPEAAALARRLTEAAGKVVIAAPDRPGFIVNRVARPFYGEALALATEGRLPAEIDAAMLGAGYRLGPFALIDLIGADINLAATEGLWQAMDRHPRYHVFDLLRAQVARGDLGRKTGRGFVGTPAAPPADAAAIVLRIEATLANEAGWLLAEGGPGADQIDQALCLGLNFPEGPFARARRHGLDTIRQTLSALEAKAPPDLRGRYLPAPWLA